MPLPEFVAAVANGSRVGVGGALLTRLPLAALARRAVEQVRVTIDEWPAFAFTARLEAAKQNLPAMPFTWPAGRPAAGLAHHDVWADPAATRYPAASSPAPDGPWPRPGPGPGCRASSGSRTR